MQKQMIKTLLAIKFFTTNVKARLKGKTTLQQRYSHTQLADSHPIHPLLYYLWPYSTHLGCVFVGVEHIELSSLSRVCKNSYLHYTIVPKKKLYVTAGHILTHWMKCWRNCPSHLNTEVSSIYIVTEEEIPCVTGRSSHFKQLHKVKELAVDIAAYWGQTNTMLFNAKVTTDNYDGKIRGFIYQSGPVCLCLKSSHTKY